MNQAFEIGTSMLWLVALYLILVNAKGFSTAMDAALGNWRRTIAVLQGRGSY